MSRALEELRPRAFAIAYRMLGSVSEAEDVVQEALLRLHRAEQEGERIESPRAYLSTVVTRLAIDQLRSARVRRETYVGEWLPEPLRGRSGRRPGATRRDGRLALAGLPGPAREPVARAARGVPAARGVRLPLRPDRRDRRQERAERPAARVPRAPARRGAAGALRRVARAARGAGRPLLRRRRRRATWRRSRPCSPRTSSCTATAAARRRRWRGRCSAARAWHGRCATGRAPRARVGGVEPCAASTSTASPAPCCSTGDGRVLERDGARHRRRADPGDPLDRQPGQAPPPRRGRGHGRAAGAGAARSQSSRGSGGASPRVS